MILIILCILVLGIVITGWIVDGYYPYKPENDNSTY